MRARGRQWNSLRLRLISRCDAPYVATTPARSPAHVVAASHLRSVAPEMTSVLIVEDGQAERTALERLFDGAGFATFAVEGGAAALVLMNHLHVDLLLLDLLLPGMSGLEVLRRVRTDLTFLDTRVVVYTAMSDPKARAEALAAGADLFLYKPLDFEEMLAALSPLLPRRSGA